MNPVPARDAFAFERTGARDVHVWPVRLEAPAHIVRCFAERLAPDEEMRAERFRQDRLRESFTLARGALRTILGLYLNIDPKQVQFAYGAHGKPALDPVCNLCFNASHSGDLAVFAFALDCELGVDMELVRRLDDLKQIARRFFCAEEVAELLSLNPEEQQQAFFQCWSRKEAYIKATGEGLSAALDTFQVSLLPTQGAAMIQIGGSVERAQEWTLHDFKPASTYQAALAYRDRPRPFTLHPVLDPVELLQI